MRWTPPLARGRLVRRYKRFLADVDIGGETVTVHCPNTGAMTGCTEPGLEVWYSTSDNPRRKYPQTLEVVCTPSGRVGINSARANALVAEALSSGVIGELDGYPLRRPEASIPGERGRFDFRLDGGPVPCWVEVKSLTLSLGGGRGAFPDAVSTRALRHVEALAARSREGERAVLLFCVQHTGVEYATPADEIHAEYGAGLRAAVASGVEVLAYGCSIERSRMAVSRSLPVRL
ncbi:MAG: DNA/RNA nuclease SfsA [Pseudomonadales bacterium]